MVGGSFPGLPAGTGLRSVNTFGGVTGEIYVPEQSGVFSVQPSIFNTGPETVTIEAVSVLSPQDQATAAQGITPWPLIPAGTVRWAFQYSSPGHESSPAAPPSLASNCPRAGDVARNSAADERQLLRPERLDRH